MARDRAASRRLFTGSTSFRNIPFLPLSILGMRFGIVFDWLVDRSHPGREPGELGPRPHDIRYPAARRRLLSSDQAAGDLLQSIAIGDVVGLRDRALLSLMTYTFARVGAAVQMRSPTIRIGPLLGCGCMKNGKITEVPVTDEGLLHEYLQSAGG